MPTSTITDSDGEWGSHTAAWKMLGARPAVFDALVAAGRVRVRAIPGAWKRYSLDDVRRVIREHTSTLAAARFSDQSE